MRVRILVDFWNLELAGNSFHEPDRATAIGEVRWLKRWFAYDA